MRNKKYFYPVTHAENNKPDTRYTVTYEFTGNPKGQPDYVVRFCDDFISAHETLQEANKSAMLHDCARLGII